MSAPVIRVLLVEDNPGDARLLRLTLEEAGGDSFVLEHARCLGDAMERLETESFDLVLLDLSLPDSCGLDTVRAAYRSSPGTPIVVLSGLADEANAFRAVQEGAQDYLVKGLLNGNLLVRSLRYAVERHRMLAELERARRHEHYVATHDLLTGLPNRQLFQDRLGQALQEARREELPLAVLFLDLDRFKLVNDTYGHAMGDRLLQAVAERLSRCIRASDTAARLGGDEFIVLLTRMRRTEDIPIVAQKILNVFQMPIILDGREFYTTSSIGISVHPFDGDDIEGLVKNADTAMYRAKANGKNNYQFYRPSMTQRAVERMELERSLRLAMDRREFILYYQPQLEVTTGRIIGMEALLRWRHPVMGLLRPPDFIPLAEETGLIVPLGDWVLRTACAQNKKWQDAGLPSVTVAVNYSGRQLQQEDPVGGIIAALDATGLDPRCLELELTESVLMHDADKSVAALQELKRIGVQISIDDFGTGYSSLSYLSRLPLGKLKIDRAFVQTVAIDPHDRAIASAIIALAHSLQIKPIAEGVETVEQLNTLRALNCDWIQGYLFSKPLLPAAAARLLVAQGATDRLLRKLALDVPRELPETTGALAG